MTLLQVDQSVCDGPDCDRATMKRGGYCRRHHDEVLHEFVLRPIPRVVVAPEPCGFVGCDRPMASKGLCDTHRQQQRKGKPLRPIGYVPPLVHGTPQGYGRGCKCEECRAANRLMHWEAREDRARRLRADPSLAPHGNTSTYGNWLCRCDPCCEANAESIRRNAAKHADAETHGWYG